MKKIFLTILLLAIVAIVSCNEPKHEKPLTESEKIDKSETKRSRLDWTGSYSGVVPCSDCSGIETSIQLKSDDSYVHTMKHLGKGGTENSANGTIMWLDEGQSIALQASDGSALRYKIGSDMLIQLDQSGKEIGGEQAMKYQLKKK